MGCTNGQWHIDSQAPVLVLGAGSPAMTVHMKIVTGCGAAALPQGQLAIDGLWDGGALTGLFGRPELDVRHR
jgi:hypothetical protein